MKKFSLLSVAVFAAALLMTPDARASHDEAEIKDLLARWEKAFKAKDTDGVMAVYAPGDLVVAYDIVPPLQCVGRDAYRKNYADFFAGYEGPMEFELRDLHIVAGSDVAFLHCVERIGGTLKGGQKSEMWVRATTGLRKIKGQWLFVHDHISVPVDFASGSALLNLKP